MAQFPSPPLHTIAQLRDDLPLTSEVVYLQSGSYTPIPQVTQAWMNEMLQLENAVVLGLAGKGAAADFYDLTELARQTLAAFLGVSAEEVAWSQNTTSATRLAIQSLTWQAGDKLALSDIEHTSTFALAQAMTQQRGVVTTVIPSGDGPTYTPEFFLAQLDRHLTPDHKLLVLCHVANTDGRRLPVKAAVQLARERGVKTLIDGAQAVGVFPVDAGEIDADFYTGSLHKWLMGPAGLGFLVVNRTHLPDFNPYWLPLTTDKPITAASRGEVGTPNYTLRLGAGYALTLLQQIGLSHIEHQMAALTAQLRTGLHNLPGVHNAGPEPWSLSSSLTTLQLAGGSLTQCQQLVTLLRKRYRIITKVRPEVCGVRISLAAFNTAAEVDQLLTALAETLPHLA
ncbi:MAG: aminotransferase class V-fold PLP-dependent enzyme [Caldilinea sp. CFX5]|nr:aminotransferase class V-fold PLP-dependent enzyme [Caldilinea sp. CFX5]